MPWGDGNIFGGPGSEIALQEVREYVNDIPRVYPPQGATPEQLGFGDGNGSIFYLSYPNVIDDTLNIYMGTPQTIDNQIVTIWAVIPSACYSQVGQQITFTPYVGRSAAPVSGAGTFAVLMSTTEDLYVGEYVLFDTEQVQITGLTPTTLTATFTTGHPANASVSSNGAPAPGVLVGARYQATATSDELMTTIMQNNAARYPDSQTQLKGCMNDYIDILCTNTELIKLIRYSDYMTDARMVIQQFDKIKTQLMTELEGAPLPGKTVPTLAHTSAPSRAAWGMFR